MLLANSSLIRKEADRDDIRAYYVPVNEIAEKLGSNKMANMAMVGALVKIMNTVSLETVFQTMAKTFSAKLLKVLDVNRKAMQQGFDAVTP